jgi:uncharacterized FlgJ-related protein
MWKLYISLTILTSTLLTFAYSNPEKKVENELYNSSVEDSCKTEMDTIIKIDTIPMITKIDTSHDFNTDNFRAYLKQINAPHAHIIYAIAKQESGFRSTLFKTHNNLFGMTRPNVRTNKSIQNGQKWAKFEHWTHSVDDMILWMSWTTNGKYESFSEQQLLNHIDRSYAHNGYSNILKKHFKDFNLY